MSRGGGGGRSVGSRLASGRWAALLAAYRMMWIAFVVESAARGQGGLSCAVRSGRVARAGRRRDGAGGRRADVRGLRLPDPANVRGAAMQTRSLGHASPCFPANARPIGALDSPPPARPIPPPAWASLHRHVGAPEGANGRRMDEWTNGRMDEWANGRMGGGSAAGHMGRAATMSASGPRAAGFAPAGARAGKPSRRVDAWAGRGFQRAGAPQPVQSRARTSSRSSSARRSGVPTSIQRPVWCRPPTLPAFIAARSRGASLAGVLSARSVNRAGW